MSSFNIDTVLKVCGILNFCLFRHFVIFCSFVYCNVTFVTLYFPTNLGTSLNMLISAVRYILTIKSAKNIQPSKSKVTFAAVAAFATIVLANLIWFIVNLKLDIPLSMIVESCYR